MNIAKIPVGINALWTILPLGSPILAIIEFFVNSFFENISVGGGVLYYTPTPLTTLCVSIFYLNKFKCTSMFDLNSFKSTFSILTLTVTQFKIFKGEISRSTETTFNKQTDGRTNTSLILLFQSANSFSSLKLFSGKNKTNSI